MQALTFLARTGAWKRFIYPHNAVVAKPATQLSGILRCCHAAEQQQQQVLP